MLKNWIISAVIFAVSASAFASASEAAGAAPESYVADWRITIGATGQVTAMQPYVRKPSKAVLAVLESDIRRWKFRAGVLDGKPVETTTFLFVTFSLVLDEKGDNYRVRYAGARTGGAVARMPEFPNFPAAERRRLFKTGGSEQVAVVVSYNENGRATNVAVDEDSPVTSGALAIAAMQEVRTWKYDPERIGGRGVAGKVLIPLCYAVYRRTPCVWNRAAGKPEVRQGESLALDSKVQLETDVVGHGS